MTDDVAIPMPADILEKVLVKGDLAQLTSAERLLYVRTVCDSVGLNPLTRPFEYITLSGKLTLYARKDATDQLREIHGISITKLERETTEGVYCVTAYAINRKGRTDSSIGAVSIEGLRGEAKANAMMKAETKAKRRVTLSLCGLGMLDETEVETISDAVIGEPRSTVVETRATDTGDPANDEAGTLLRRITAQWAKLAMSPRLQEKLWRQHCGNAPFLSGAADPAALAALLQALGAK